MLYRDSITPAAMNDPSATQNRKSTRSNVLLTATLEVPGESLPVVLRNLSSEGALVQAERLPLPGTRVLFHRQGLSAPARIAWSHCGYAGIEFDCFLYPKELMRHVPSAQPKLPPLPVTRRPGLGATPLTAAERSLIETWAVEAQRVGG